MNTETPGPDAAAFLRKNLELAEIIHDHDFNLRETHLLTFLRRQSLGCGRPQANVPRLEFFVRAERISRGNVSAILRRLKACCVIEEDPQWCYGFLLLPPPAYAAANWRVPIRTEELEVIRQLELLERPPSLSSALRETFIESRAIEGKPGRVSGTASHAIGADDHSARGCPGVPDSGTGVPDLGTRPGVPDSGTGVPDLGTRPGVPDSGTLAKVPVGPGTYGSVPESGTAHCNIVNNALEQCCNVTSVPESGTPGKFPRVSGLTPDQQELFELLGKAGAFGARLESRGCWFSMVQNHYHVTQRLFGELRYAKLNRTVRNPGAYMMDLWKRLGRPDV